MSCFDSDSSLYFYFEYIFSRVVFDDFYIIVMMFTNCNKNDPFTFFCIIIVFPSGFFPPCVFASSLYIYRCWKQILADRVFFAYKHCVVIVLQQHCLKLPYALVRLRLSLSINAYAVVPANMVSDSVFVTVDQRFLIRFVVNEMKIANTVWETKITVTNLNWSYLWP